MKTFLYSLLVFVFMFTVNLKADVLKKIEISGNSRISSETIKVYGDIELNKNDLNLIEGEEYFIIKNLKKTIYLIFSFIIKYIRIKKFDVFYWLHRF